ncbi:V-set and immunoglobulin domain-containing protein 4 isoform X3 [Hippopotamus amphibius kiboko]|uniref:V-set and immunoglobulin domain-containing protein 4 isoform X3 n=1 Tax=Hippopotamus amphibius kiboko TaxID=575201 RepID=UPI0025920BE3|nr:V-set and immunoglobulin domain-containing protein 4 isoform X3 [Hippopotamus amphibius kiboko]
MGLLLGLLLLSNLLVVTYGHPILEVPESVTGPWKGDVNIPCTYGPLQGYTQVLVKWLVERGSDPVTIFLRDSSGDHIQQAKYRGRLHVNHEVPGDVSLQLNTLEMDDRSHYTCEVTWQTPDGNQVVREKIIELRVQKHSSKPLEPKIKSPSTMQSPLEATSTMNSSWGWTTEVDGYVGKTSAGLGKGLPIFAIILIISLCCIVVTTMTYIMVCRKTPQQEHVYEVARVHARDASDSGETMRVAIFASGCSSEEPASQTLGNNYSDEPCLGQEYQIIAQINSDYARLLHTVPPDYELLATKGENVC